MPSTGTIFQAIIVMGAVLLASSTLSKRWFYAKWVKTAFWIVFVAAMLDMALAFVLTHLAFSDAVFWRIRTGRAFAQVSPRSNQSMKPTAPRRNKFSVF